MPWLRTPLAAVLAATLAVGAVTAAASPARAEAPTIVAVVNDQPITELDLTQRIALLEVLDDMPRGGMNKRQALQAIIDDTVKIQEARRFNMLPTEAEVNDRINRIAKSMKLTRDQLLAKLKSKGISETTFRTYMQADMGFTRIIQGKYREDIKVTPAEIDAKSAEIKSKVNAQMNKVMNDPRMKPVNVYTLMEINLPVDGEDPMLLQSRAIEAQQVLQRLKGCNSLKAASEGIFDVKKGKTFEADAAKLPPQMKQALDKAGTGRAIGPMRGKGGIQLIALCGTRKITPPKPNFEMPDREQIERIVINEKYDKLEQDYLVTARDKIYVEYRDANYAQQ